MIIKAIVASTFKDYENGWSYSDSALVNLAESAKDKPVFYMKKRIGVVDSGTYKDSKVIIVANINESAEIINNKLYLVPGGLTDFETIGDIINKCIAHRYVFTENPSDKTLTVFERMDF